MFVIELYLIAKLNFKANSLYEILSSITSGYESKQKSKNENHGLMQSEIA